MVMNGGWFIIAIPTLIGSMKATHDMVMLVVLLSRGLGIRAVFPDKLSIHLFRDPGTHFWHVPV